MSVNIEVMALAMRRTAHHGDPINDEKEGGQGLGYFSEEYRTDDCVNDQFDDCHTYQSEAKFWEVIGVGLSCVICYPFGFLLPWVGFLVSRL